MKRTLALLATLFVFLLLVGPAPAVATHKQGHHRPPACDKNKAELTDKEKDKKKKGKKKGNKNKNQNRKPNDKNKHCYPPTSAPTTSQGRQASFQAELPAQRGGLTVGMATIAAVGALGGLLVIRRRWAFRASRRT